MALWDMIFFTNNFANLPSKHNLHGNAFITHLLITKLIENYTKKHQKYTDIRL